ncbi:uncharacterized protein LOC135809811 [Sycon ciliatum]|uniref:uncharacterized protein LOC135809811 n=1 Tax=Sycon ciliatum TaxID=27933 RepID=UPI0031F6CE49
MAADQAQEPVAIVESHMAAFPRVLGLNVGGTLYTTTWSTLTRHSSADTDVQSEMLGAMFSGRHASVPQDAEGRYFIDRDGRHFHFILNYLRHKQQPNAADVFVVHEEASYYQVPGLLKWCECQPLWKAHCLHKSLQSSVSRHDITLFGQALIQCTIDRTGKPVPNAEKWMFERPRVPGDKSMLYSRLRVAVIEGTGQLGSQHRKQNTKKAPSPRMQLVGVEAHCEIGTAEHKHLFDSLPARDSHVDVLLLSQPVLGGHGPSALDLLVAKTNGELAGAGMCVLREANADGMPFRCVECNATLRIHAIKLHVDLGQGI